MDIAVIGGSDGPTSIFIAGFSWYAVATIVIVFIAVIGIIIWYIKTKKRKK